MNLNSDNYKNVTILIVTFKSYNIIEDCLNNIDPKFNIILIENSDDKEFTLNLEKKFKNLKTINIGYDSGWGYALNRGVENVKTDYFIIMNPDTFPENGCLEKLINTAESNEDVGIVTPVTILKNNTKEFSSYGNFNNKLTKKNSEKILQVDWVHGNILLVKKEFFEEAGCFDENIFIEFDERDLQKRFFNLKKKILIDFNAKSHHLDGKSADTKFAFQMKCEKSWHHAWSGYYYFKKHYGIIYALYKCLPFALINFLKFMYFNFSKDEKKRKIYKLFFLGFYNSVLNRKSFYRAEID